MSITPYTKRCKRKINLSKIKIRLISSNENLQWNDLMEKFHYLANGNMVGLQLRYVAEIGDRTIALLGFSNASYHLESRDKWIGWSELQCEQRRGFVIQNSRFLVLPDVNTRNVASKVLALCTKQIAKDWEDKFDHPVLVLETFTELDGRRRGIGYLAAGWERTGETKGYQKDKRNFYRETCVGKTVWCKELFKGAKALLCEDELPPALRKYEKNISKGFARKKLGKGRLKSLFERLRCFDQPSKRGQRYSYSSCLCIIICGIFAGCKGVRECVELIESFSQGQLRAMRLWRSPRDNQYKVPSYVTIWRAATSVDPMKFESIVQQWFNEYLPEYTQKIHIDGKSITSTLDENQKGTHIVSAISVGTPPF